MDGKLAFIFPGQGSQSVGMGYSLIQKFPDFEPIFFETLREADARLGFSLSTILRDGPAEKLKETEITQPALLTVSTAVGRWLKTKRIVAEIALGHSLGEYSALVHAEALSFSDAVKLVQTRGRLMQTAVPVGEGGMGALLGADLASAQKLCEKTQSETNLVLEVSLLNAPGQIVVSGHASAIKRAQELAREFGIRKLIPLEVSGPFHCSLLRDAGVGLLSSMRELSIFAPKFPVISNTTAQEEKTPDEIRSNLVAQVSKTVRWEESVRFAGELGCTRFLEVGSGSVLTGLIKKILPEKKAISVDELNSLDELRS